MTGTRAIEELARFSIEAGYCCASSHSRHSCFLGENDPNYSLKSTLRAGVNPCALDPFHCEALRLLRILHSGSIAEKVVNQPGDEVAKVCRVG